MRCDLHVHTWHSGMCSVPVVRSFCRESYSHPEAVYERLKCLGMDLVTVTDHDSIDAAESLRSQSDFFLSEEVTCRMPSGTEVHIAVYDISERQHLEIQRRRDDLPSLSAYLKEERLFFSANHVFSGLTGRRVHGDFEWFEAVFPALETLNGHLPETSNRHSVRLAAWMGKAVVGGSDAHTLRSLGSAFTEVPDARDKEEFLAGLQAGKGRVHGESGGYWKLTREALLISCEMPRENSASAVLLPLALMVPLVTLASFVRDVAFAFKWSKALEESGLMPPSAGRRAPGVSGNAAGYRAAC